MKLPAEPQRFVKNLPPGTFETLEKPAHVIGGSAGHLATLRGVASVVFLHRRPTKTLLNTFTFLLETQWTVSVPVSGPQLHGRWCFIAHVVNSSRS